MIDEQEKILKQYRAQDDWEQEKDGEITDKLKSKNYYLNLEKELRKQIFKQQEDQKELEGKNKILNVTVKELEAKMLTSRANYQSLIDAEANQKKEIQSKYNLKITEYNELLERFQSLLQNQTQQASTVKFDQFSSDENETNKIDNRKQAKILFHQVKEFGLELKYNLMLNKIKYEEIQNILFTRKMYEKNYATLKQLQQILKKHPFNLTNENDILLVARFLIENNEEDFLVVDPNKKQELSIILCIFRKLVGNYQLWDTENEKQIVYELATLFDKYSSSLNDNFQVMISMHKEKLPESCIMKEEMQKALQYINANLTFDQDLYFYMKMYGISKNMNLIQTNRIFTDFAL